MSRASWWATRSPAAPTTQIMMTDFGIEVPSVAGFLSVKDGRDGKAGLHCQRGLGREPGVRSQEVQESGVRSQESGVRTPAPCLPEAENCLTTMDNRRPITRRLAGRRSPLIVHRSSLTVHRSSASHPGTKARAAQPPAQSPPTRRCPSHLSSAAGLVRERWGVAVGTTGRWAAEPQMLKLLSHLPASFTAIVGWPGSPWPGFSLSAIM